MAGAKLTRKRGEGIHLSEEQRKVIDWQESEGDEPSGGWPFEEQGQPSPPNDRSSLMICCGCRQGLPVRVR